MSARELTVTVTGEDWVELRHGWRMPLLEIPGAQMEAFYPDGADGNQVALSSVPVEHGLLKWNLSAPPPKKAAVVISLTRDLAQEVPALEKSKLELEGQKLSLERAKNRWQAISALLGGVAALLAAYGALTRAQQAPAPGSSTAQTATAKSTALPITDGSPSWRQSPKSVAEVLEATRKGQPPHDYLRVALVPPTAGRITHLGRPEREYVFATHTSYATPPMPVGKFVQLLGNRHELNQDLLVIRCQSTDERELHPDGDPPRLATWPSILGFLARKSAGVDCRHPATSDARLFCQAAAIQSEQQALKSASATSLIADTYSRAAKLLGNPEAQATLERLLGINPLSFGGFGMSLAGGGTMRPYSQSETQSVFASAVLPEFLIQNVPLEKSRCHCVRVSPYSDRDADLLDVEAIWRDGDATCKRVARLPEHP